MNTEVIKTTSINFPDFYNSPEAGNYTPEGLKAFCLKLSIGIVKHTFVKDEQNLATIKAVYQELITILGGSQL